MAQFRKDTKQFLNQEKTIFEVNMLSTPDGQVVSNTNPLPVTLGNTTVEITSNNVNVTVPNTITVNSSTNDPIHVHITEVGTSGNLQFSYMPIGGNVGVTGTVNIGNPLTANVTGTVNIGNPLTANVIVTNVLAANVTGTVNIGNPLTANVTGNVRIFQSTGAAINTANPLPVTAAITGTVTSTPVAGGSDAFGRLRTSDAFTLGDYKHTYGIDPNFIDEFGPGANVIHISNQAAARLSTNNSPSSYAIHQTKQYHNYMPGKSQLIKSTINFYNATANVTKRTGYFDANNGIYFEQAGNSTLSMVIRSDTGGTIAERRVPQAQWNMDTCNTSITGTVTGNVGSFNLDISNTQIFWTDFQWLGVGRVRTGFVYNGNLIVAHEFYNSNFLPTVYMSNPNLPIRCEIRNTGATTGAYFDQICSTVISEGGYVESGIDWAITTGSAAQSVTTASGNYPLIAIRLKNNFRTYPNRVTVRMGNINVYAESYPAYWKLIKLANTAGLTLANTTWISADTNSAVEYNLTGTAMVGGDEMENGIVGTSSPGGSGKGTGTSPVNNPSNAKKNFIAQNIASSNSEIYVVAIQAIGGTSDVWAGIQWREIY